MSSTKVPLHVLLVDDDANIRRTLSITLKESQCSVSQAGSVEEALRLLRSQKFDWLLTDFRMEDQTGLDLIGEAKKIDPELLMVVMTAYASIENAVSVIKEGAFDYLPKPFTNAQLIHLMNKVRMILQLKKENQQLKQEKAKRNYFLGFTSPASRRLEDFVRKLAPTDSTILLVGESGTGKSELARLIHDRSPRADRPFVTVYCTTLTESLLESELFGHVKGAFTGASHDKEGKFELADGGTLFLDEIGDLSPNAQAKLLRFLQDRVFERVGSNQEITVNTRVLAATNKDLQEAVAAGKFREDLYFRMNVFECPLVPLRHRMEDLPVFMKHFLEELQKQGLLKRELRFSPDVLKVFQGYSWPGNLRELRNILERLALLAPDREIQPDDLPPSILLKGKKTSKDEPPLISIEELEKNHIQYVLSREKSLEKAAEILGITPVTLWRKRKEYGLE
jgi:DNA-binding NtrC family response regulator